MNFAIGPLKDNSPESRPPPLNSLYFMNLRVLYSSRKNPRMQPSGPELSLPPTGDGQLVLCVDDEKTGLMVRRILLERNGYKVLTSERGFEAVGLLEQFPIEAVILDYAMPEMNGGQVAAIMRQRKPQVPILLLSAYVTLPDEVLQLVDLSMTKGDGPNVLLGHLHRLIANPTHGGWGPTA
jgi:CheY-like chemotaxis protein